jgi:hypothetical protein
MDQAFISTFAALAGTVIGGVTSFATTWLTTTSQARAARLAAERGKREDLYGRFMEQLAALYADALQSDSVNYEKLTAAYAVRGRIALIASDPVFATADQALKFIIDLNISRRRTDEEMRKMMDDEQADMIGAFAQACRREIESFR